MLVKKEKKIKTIIYVRKFWKKILNKLGIFYLDQWHFWNALMLPEDFL